MREEAEEMAVSVVGRVQGVGFRCWTRRQAMQLGLEGAVCNRADGSVEVRARGSERAVREFLDWLREGPPGARVDRVEPIASRLRMSAGAFQILRG